MKPSVSKLTALLDKPALLNWANKIGLQGIQLDDYRNKSRAGGTSLHSQIHDYIKSGTPFKCEETQIACDIFMNGIEVLGMEEEFETDYFTGRLDIRFKYLNDIYIADFKSNQARVYFENKLQLVAYRMAKPCNKIAIISIPDFNIIPVLINDFTPYEEILKNLSSIYNLKSLLGEN